MIMKIKYTDLPIKRKIMILIFILIFSVSIFSLIALQIAFRSYDEQLYDKSADILNLSYKNIENELKQVENISYNIIGDAQIQEYLGVLDTNVSTYDTHRIVNDLDNILLNYAITKKYITSINIINNSGIQVIAGIDTKKITNSQLEEIQIKTSEEKGRVVLIPPNNENQDFILARQIRKTKDLSLKPLGTLCIKVDMDQIVNMVYDLKEDKNELYIRDNSQIIYPYGNQIKNNIHLEKVFSGSKGYDIVTINNTKKFVSYLKSDYSQWIYINIISYDNIYNSIITVRRRIISFYIILFIIYVFLASGFSRSITKPIEKLAKKMKKVENEEFDINIKEYIDYEGDNEIKHLNKDFEIMLSKIDKLIEENYKKKLVIKDTQYKALQAQINPHFLYNTLDSINWMAKVNYQEDISEMVKALGNLLRNSLSKNDHLITIGEELNLLKDYIKIQTFRYEERLQFIMNVHEEILSYCIPKLVLQPIVENSIKYGLDKMIEGCKIEIKSVLHKDCIEIRIIDDGPGMDEHVLEKIKNDEVRSKGNGIGLKNIDDRIKMLYGIEYGLYINSKLEKGTTISMYIPYKMG